MVHKRSRYQFKFWLDMNNDSDLLLAEEIDDLRATRQFTQTIRDGLRLISTLRAGNTSVLFELFPLLETKLQSPKPSEEVAAADHLQVQLERIERLLQKENKQPNPTLTPVGQGGPKQLNITKIEVPTFDDDDDGDLLVVKKDENAGQEAAQNFINAMLALQQ